jgi:hypothetical protein
MQTPKKVKIGAQVFYIEERSVKKDGTLNDNSYGYTLDQGNLIVIDANIAFTKKQQTLLHEIIHAIGMVYGSGQKQPGAKDDYEVWEHHFIGIWEAPMLSFIKDNPEVVAWMQLEEEPNGEKKEGGRAANTSAKR